MQVGNIFNGNGSSNNQGNNSNNAQSDPKGEMFNYINCCVDSLGPVEVLNNKRDFNSIVIQTNGGPLTIDIRRSVSVALAMQIMRAETSRADSQVVVLSPEKLWDGRTSPQFLEEELVQILKDIGIRPKQYKDQSQ